MTDVERLVKLGAVVSTCCQAGERGEKLKLGKQKAEMGRQKPEDRGQRSGVRGQRTEAGGRWGIYLDSVAKGWFPAFVFAAVTLSQPYCWGYA